MVGQTVATYFTAFCGGCGGAMWSSYYSYEATGSMGAAYRSGAINYASNYAFAYVDGLKLNVPQSMLAHGLVGGISAEMQGGTFEKGFITAGAAKGAKEYFKWMTGREPTPELTNGESGPKDGIAIHPEGSRLNNMGVSYPKAMLGQLRGIDLWISEESPLFRFITKTIPGMDTWAQIHDTWGNWLDKPEVRMWNMVTNYGSMPLAAAGTYFALSSGAPSIGLTIEHKKKRDD